MKPIKSIAEIELEARALGLSYGEYVAGLPPRKKPLAVKAAGSEEPAAGPEGSGENPEQTQPQKSDWPGRKAVEAMDPETGEVLLSYPSLSAAVEEFDLHMSGLSAAIRSYERGDPRPRRWGGLIWRYARQLPA